MLANKFEDACRIASAACEDLMQQNFLCNPIDGTLADSEVHRIESDVNSRLPREIGSTYTGWTVRDARSLGFTLPHDWLDWSWLHAKGFRCVINRKEQVARTLQIKMSLELIDPTIPEWCVP